VIDFALVWRHPSALMPLFGSASTSSLPTYYGARGSFGPGRIPRSDLLIVGNDAPRASRRSGPAKRAAEVLASVLPGLAGPANICSL
jgi:hypothetical protein